VTKIGDRQLQAMRDVAQAFVLRRESELRSEIEQNVRDVRHDQLAVFQERRGEGDVRLGLAVQDFHHRVHAVAALTRFTRHVDVWRAGIFQREPDELAAALQSVPVMEFVSHVKRLLGKVCRVCGDSGVCAFSTCDEARVRRIGRATRVPV